MDDPASNENPPKDFNKIDLTQLHGFSFGTQWTQDKSSPQDRRDDRPRRDDDRRPGGGQPEARRDRRAFRRPAGPGTAAPGGGAEEHRPAGAPGAREGQGGPDAGRGGDRRTPRFAGGRDGGGGGERRFDGAGRRGGPQDRGDRSPQERGPYISPFFNVTFYPEDIGFSALAKAIRTSCRTYELFEIARVIVGKNDRFVAVLQRKASEASSSAHHEGGSAEPVGASGGVSAKPAPLAISVPDGLPFESEEAAIAHVLSKHLNTFFDTAEVEVEPPKGNFQVINKCGVTGELLGPPNYHRYNQIVQQHFNANVGRMSFEAYRGRIQTVREPEVVNQWLEKMKKATRYTWKLTPAGETAPTFDAMEEARNYLLTHARDKVVRVSDSARMHGKSLELLPQGEIRRAIEGALERQRRFPLDTANALRGRLRREGFTIFKKGSKGISYVCSVKRKFRVPGQTFSDSINALISFIEANPMVKASELPAKLLGIQPPPAPPAPAAPPGETTPPLATSGSVPPIPTTMLMTLSPDDQSRLSRLHGDLRWLVTEGYVTEFIDGRLFAPPAMTEARKQEVEKDDHDPENFPETPASAPAHAPSSDTAAPIASTESSGAEESPAEVSAPAAEASTGEDVSRTS